jgi:hypothetical protein
LVVVLHQRLQYPNVNFKLFKRFGEVQNSIKIFALCNFLRDELILLIELLNKSEVVSEILMIDGFIDVLCSVIFGEGLFDNGVAQFDLLLHALGDGVFERGKLHIGLDDLLMGQAQNFMGD